MASNLLVTLTDMKTSLGETTTSYDNFLTEQLTIATAAVEGYCARKFLKKSYRQTFYRADFKISPKRLSLYHYPVQEITDISEDDTTVPATDYRIAKDKGLIVSDGCFMSCADMLEVEYDAGYDYSQLPALITSAVKSIVKDAYDRKVTGLDVNFGKDIQRLSVPGVVSLDFDYTLSASDRDVKFGQVLGNYVNLIDSFRSERAIIGGPTVYVEEI